MHQCHRQARADLHVAQIFAEDRRHAAQRAEGQVERLPIGQRRVDQQCCRPVAGIGDHADALENDQPPGLRGDIRRRIPQPEIRRIARAVRLGDDLAVALGIEAVGHDAVVAADRSQRANGKCADLAAAGRRLEGLQGGEHRHDRRHRARVLCQRLDVHAQTRPGAMRLQVQQDAIRAGQCGKMPESDLVLREGRAGGGAQQSAGCLSDRLMQRPPEHGSRVQAQDLGQVRAGMADPPVDAACGEQRTVRLYRTGDVDRLAIADAQIGVRGQTVETLLDRVHRHRALPPDGRTMSGNA